MSPTGRIGQSKPNIQVIRHNSPEYLAIKEAFMRYPKLRDGDVPQSEPLNERQTKNNAGGFVFTVDPMDQLRRFLVLGSDRPTYYCKAVKLTRDNAAVVEACWARAPNATAKTIIDVSVLGLAPKVDATLYALALGFASKQPQAVQQAVVAFPHVVRTASHLFEFLSAVTTLRGWGAALRKAVARWYEGLSEDDLVYHGMKYRQRAGFTHQRAIELSHPRVKENEGVKGALLRKLRGLDSEKHPLPDRYHAFLEVQSSDNPHAIADLVRKYNLPWEAVPTNFLNDKIVMTSLMPTMPLGALIRQLGRLTSLDVLDVKLAKKKLTDEEYIKKARIHPYNVLVASRVYASGTGERTKWEVKPAIVAALEHTFRLAFQNVEPCNKRFSLSLDVSGSMGTAHIQGGPVTAREASAAMTLITLAAEDECHVSAFSTNYQQLSLHSEMSLAEAISRVSRLDFGGTDCSLPMLYAMKAKRKFDAFVIYTDSETWAGNVHPMQALNRYRDWSGIDAELIVVGMTSTGFTIADPKDPGCLDVVGFDSSAPQVMSSFVGRQ